MDPNINIPKDMLDEKVYSHLAPKEKSEYMEATLQEILVLNKDIGITISNILAETYFDRKAVSKYLEKLVAKRIGYRVQRGKTIVYYINGRLIHHLFNKTVEVGNRHYSFKALFDGKQVSLFIQEIKKNDLGVIEEGGGIIVPLKDIDDFSQYISKVKTELPLIKQKLMEMIE